MAKQYTLPDLLSLCPLKLELSNPHYKEAAAESRAWINSYNVFTDRKRAFFIQGSNELLVSHTYPYAGFEQFRTCCDFVNLLFVVDEVSDDQDAKDARTTCEVFLNAMCDPDWDDKSVLAKITKEFRARYIRLAGCNTSRRFFGHCKDYIDAVSREAELRERKQVLSLADFLPLRRENSAIRTCFGLIEYVLGIDLPDKVFADDVFMSLYWAGADMVCLANDVYSYNMEQAKGHSGNNILTVLCHEKNIDIQAAADEVGVYFGQLMDRFMVDKARLPSFGSALDASVARYVDALGDWVVGNLEWSFDTARYFGAEHAEIKKTLVVTLRPSEVPEFDSDNSEDEGPAF